MRLSLLRAAAPPGRRRFLVATVMTAVAVSALLLGTTSGASGVHQGRADSDGDRTAAASRAGGAPVVVAVSIDGLRSGVLSPSRTPALHRMITEGASTLNARTAFEKTVTMPNHTGMLTGRRVWSKRGHHIDFNHDNGSTVHQQAGRYRASLFDIVHDRGGRTALFASKDKFALFDRSWNAAHGAPDTVGADQGRDKIDRFVYAKPGRLVNKLVRNLGKSPRDATFLHIALPDQAGHGHGWGSSQYLAAVERSDELVGRLLDTIDASSPLRARVTVIVTADHGGEGRDHGRSGDPDNYTIPFLVWGADAAPAADLYDLNPERTDPGNGRPHYSDAPPIRNTDVASLVTTLLGHRSVPGGQLRGTTPLEVS